MKTPADTKRKKLDRAVARLFAAIDKAATATDEVRLARKEVARLADKEGDKS